MAKMPGKPRKNLKFGGTLPPEKNAPEGKRIVLSKTGKQKVPASRKSGK